MKTHHLSNIILILVLITALAGLYYVYKGTGKAIQIPEIDTIANCCCQSETGVFKTATTQTYSTITIAECAKTCAESSTINHPVTTLGPC